MFNTVQNLIITQVPSEKYPNRNKVFNFDFVSKFSAKGTWADLTDKAIIILPRAIYFKDGNGRKITWNDTQIYGNPDKSPLIMRGDKVSFKMGYSYFSPTQNGEFDRTNLVTKTLERFAGYITKIQNRTPLEIVCEDNMFGAKQTMVENKTWNLDGTTYTLEKMLKEIITKSTFPGAKDWKVVIDNFEHKVGKFTTYNVTLAQVLSELRKNYHFESYFRLNELRCGIIRYYPQDRVDHVFQFGDEDTGNIISDNLIYTRADDLRVGIKAISINKLELAETNSDGKTKKKKKRLEVLVGDKDGELRTLHFWNIDSEAELKKKAEVMLPFVKYEGFRGTFTTFGLPYVKHGDSVQLVSKKITELDGVYLVKQVDVECGPGGHRQTITLDIRIDGLTPDQIKNYQETGI